MIETQERRKELAERIHSGVLKLEFGSEDAFGKELRRRVDDFLRSTGRRKRGGRAMVLKTVIVLAWFAASYVLLVFAAQTLGQGLLPAVSLGLVSGLNYHKEHHLFPAICHINYPSLSPIVAETCREFGIPYKEHKSFPAGIAAHYRWLRRMGTAE